MNSIFGMLMELWILRVSWKVSEAFGFTLTLHETQSIYNSFNWSKVELIFYIFIYYKYLKYKYYC